MLVFYEQKMARGADCGQLWPIVARLCTRSHSLLRAHVNYCTSGHDRLANKNDLRSLTTIFAQGKAL